MTADAWRYEPLDPNRFKVGDGPFRVRGLAYAGLFQYVDHRLPGGRAAFYRAVGESHPYRSYYDQIFVVAGSYDVSPYLHIFKTLAKLEGTTVGRVIIDRSRASA